MNKIILVVALLFATACGRKDSDVDAALNNDLVKASESTQVVSPVEQTPYLANGQRNPNYVSPVATTVRPIPAKTRVIYRNRPVYRSSGSATQSAPRQQTVVKHTVRDAAIGAGAGAIIGAVTSRNKVKGAIIGGAAGAILGGVIGNNVDKTKR